DHITVGGKRHDGKVHSDGIALDRKNGILYFHALTGKTLYGIPTRQLIDRKVEEDGIFSMKTPSPDGMIMDGPGNLYMGDLEKNRIVYLTPDRREIKVLASGPGISWPDTFSIHDGYLYFTNSRIQEAKGDISNMEFTLKRVKLPE
uniref:L-dopachrome tautomerase-related protein n=1 Tax=uncultured Akkermansia sp. TaxID=512294 RepID=UPI00265D0AEA